MIPGLFCSTSEFESCKIKPWALTQSATSWTGAAWLYINHNNNNNNNGLSCVLFLQAGAHSTLQSKEKTQYKLPRANIFLQHRASDSSCAMRHSNLKQKMQFGSTNINYTTRQSLLMKIFAQFLCFQASWCSHVGSPLISAKMSPQREAGGDWNPSRLGRPGAYP